MLGRLLLLGAAIVSGAVDATCGTGKGPNGEPAWAMTGDSSNGWHEREAYRCVTVCGGIWETDRPYGNLWCSKAMDAGSSATPGVEALASLVAAQAAGQAVDTTTQTLAVGAAAFDLGAALHDYLAAESSRGRAQAAAEAAARAAAAQRHAEEEARRKEASWQRLRSEMVMDTPDGGLAPKLDSDEDTLELKLGDEPAGVASLAGPVVGLGYARAVMPTRRTGSPPVKMSRHTPAAPPAATAKKSPPDRPKACGWVGPAELRQGNVWFRLYATNCSSDQRCTVEGGGISPRSWRVTRGGAHDLMIERLPTGVTIYDYEQVRGIKKACATE